MVQPASRAVTPLVADFRANALGGRQQEGMRRRFEGRFRQDRKVESSVRDAKPIPNGLTNWRYIMKVVKSLLLGSAAGLLTVAGAQAADLPTRKAAPVAYVRICDAYGAGFFYIPGTDTCLKVGGLALFEARVFNTPYSIGAGFFSAAAPGALAAGLGT